MNPEQTLQFQKQEKILELPELEKDLPFNEKLNELFKNKVLIESEDGKKYILQGGTRIAVIADVNGVKIPFYQSSGGTGGKVSGKWYPFFGNRGAWLIKGDIEELNKGYDIQELKEMMEYLDNTLPEYLYTNLLTAEQKKVFSDATLMKQISKLESVKALHKEFILDKDEASEYMAKILGYNLNDAPTDGNESKNSDFVKNILKSVKQKLEVFKKF